MNNLISLVTVAVFAMGFSYIFNESRRTLFWAVLGAVLTWGVYLGTGLCTRGLFLPTFLASVVCALYAEIMARIKKTPVPGFMIIGAIALIPGKGLYYTMSYAAAGDIVRLRIQGQETLMSMLAIAGGISLVSSVCMMLYHFREN